jgi:hypothetical protein
MHLGGADLRQSDIECMQPGPRGPNRRFNTATQPDSRRIGNADRYAATRDRSPDRNALADRHIQRDANFDLYTDRDPYAHADRDTCPVWHTRTDERLTHANAAGFSD